MKRHFLLKPQIGPLARYGLSTAGKTLPWAAADTLTLYFLTDVVRLPPGQAGLVTLAFYLWAAACDPVAGWLFDLWSRHRRRTARYLIAGAVVMGGAFVAMFCKPSAHPALTLLAAGLAFRAAFALIDVPHNALLGRLALGGGDGTRLGAIRLVSGILATLAAAYAARGALAARASDAPSAFLAYAVEMALVSVVLFLTTLPLLEARIVEPGVPRSASSAPPRRFPGALAAFFLSAMVTTVTSGLFSKDIVYVAKYAFNDVQWTVVGLQVFTLGKLIGVPVWLAAAARWGGAAAMRSAFLLIVTTGAVLWFAPPSQTDFGLALVGFGAGLGGVNMMSWSLLPEATAEVAGQTGIFGWYTALNKIAAGASGYLTGFMLAKLQLLSPVLSQASRDGLYRFVAGSPIAGALLALLLFELYVVARVRADGGRGHGQDRRLPAEI